jgi:hypothetical protein
MKATAADNFLEALIQAKRACMVEHGDMWALKPGIGIVWARAPAEWMQGGARDMRVPPASYWPGGKYPDRLETFREVVHTADGREPLPAAQPARW